MALWSRTRHDDDLAPLYAAARARAGLVVALLAVAVVGWAWTARQMSGMDDGPWTSVGALGWFLGVWVVMMTAMMFPSVAPTVALYSRTAGGRTALPSWLFACGYLLTWTTAGVGAYGIALLVRHVPGAALDWQNGGRVLAGSALVAAAAYELTPFKDVCLGKCRSPLGALLGSWRGGRWGAIRMGVVNGAWCVGCCWALMTALFALGIMSVSWMALVAAIIAAEKLLPWRRSVTYATATLLLTLGILVLAAPELVPTLTIPGHGTMPMS